MPIFECARCNEMTYSASAGVVQACPTCASDRVRVLDGAFADARAAARDLAAGDHATLVFDDPARVAPFCARYLTEGVDRGEHVVAAVPADLRSALDGLLAPDVSVLVDWHEQLAIYGDFDADRVAAMYEEMISAHPGVTRILAGLDAECVGGVDPADFDRYERMAHAIITRLGANVICVYDERSLPPEIVAIAVRRHGLAVEDGAVRRNERFEYEPA